MSTKRKQLGSAASSAAAALLLLAACTVVCAGPDQSGWAKLLAATVTEDGWIDYPEIRDRRQSTLDAYLAELADTDDDTLESDDAKQAFWINAYNAVTIRILIDEGLPDTVPHAALFGKNIFKQEDYRVAGKVRSLDEIEHEILRKRFDDPRIHAALVCGASSCPRLRPEPYRAGKLDRQLDEEVHRWLTQGRDKAGHRKNELDLDAGVFRVSRIFKWFQEDFNGGGEEGVLAFLSRHVDEPTRRYLQQHDVEIEYLDYDWSLNSQREP